MLYVFLFPVKGVKIVRAAAGVARSIFVSDDGFGYWCGEGMGELKNVSFEDCIIHCIHKNIYLSKISILFLML